MEFCQIAFQPPQANGPFGATMWWQQIRCHCDIVANKLGACIFVVLSLLVSGCSCWPNNMSEKLCLQCSGTISKKNVNKSFGYFREDKHWCDSGLWGWSTGGSTQSDLGFLNSVLPEVAYKEQTQPSSGLYERYEVWKSFGLSWFPLLWRGKCLPAKSWLFPGHSWRISVERLDWKNGCAPSAPPNTCEKCGLTAEEKYLAGGAPGAHRGRTGGARGAR